MYHIKVFSVLSRYILNLAVVCPPEPYSPASFHPHGTQGPLIIGNHPFQSFLLVHSHYFVMPFQPQNSSPLGTHSCHICLGCNLGDSNWRIPIQWRSNKISIPRNASNIMIPVTKIPMKNTNRSNRDTMSPLETRNPIAIGPEKSELAEVLDAK